MTILNKAVALSTEIRELDPNEVDVVAGAASWAMASVSWINETECFYPPGGGQPQCFNNSTQKPDDQVQVD